VADRTGRANGEEENQQVRYSKSKVTGTEPETKFRDPGQRKHNESQATGSRDDGVDVKSSLRPCDFPPAIDKLSEYTGWDNAGDCRAETPHIRAILICAAVSLKKACPEIEKEKYHGKEETEGPEVDEYRNENGEKWDCYSKIECLP
jgi:hypothetical protein